MSDISTVLDKVSRCVNYQTIFSMEKIFNAVGLTLQRTAKNWMILCKIVDNKPLADEVLEDYIFLATIEDQNKEISERIINHIVDFIQETATGPSEVKNIARTWRNGVRTYGKAINIVNEDITLLAQIITE